MRSSVDVFESRLETPVVRPKPIDREAAFGYEYAATTIPCFVRERISFFCRLGDPAEAEVSW